MKFLLATATSADSTPEHTGAQHFPPSSRLSSRKSSWDARNFFKDSFLPYLALLLQDIGPSFESVPKARLSLTPTSNTLQLLFRTSDKRRVTLVDLSSPTSNKLAGPNQQKQTETIRLFSTYFVLICTTNKNFVPRAV